MRHRRTLARMRFALMIGAVLAVSAGPAWAGDAAARHLIGFSPDGTYFAFEQYGQLDAGASASGYSEIDIIDIGTDEGAALQPGF